MKTRSTPKIDVTSGSDNVFADIGFGEKSAELRVKAELTRRIHHRIREMKLTQTRAAARLGISQPDVSKLMAGRHTGFSVARLLAFLNALDLDVDIVVRPHENRRAGLAKTRVEMVCAN